MFHNIVGEIQLMYKWMKTKTITTLKETFMQIIFRQLKVKKL